MSCKINLFFFQITVKEKLTADPDSEIATTSLRVSLLCPVSCFFFFNSLKTDSDQNVSVLGHVWERFACVYLCVNFVGTGFSAEACGIPRGK